jgi:hypothetical protein
MRRSLPVLFTVSALSVSACLSSWSQGLPSPTPKNSGPRFAATAAAADAAEKAQDEALVQKLESESAARGDAKPKGPKALSWGGGIAPVTPDGMVFRGQSIMTRPAAGSRALVVRTSQPDAKTQPVLEEDLAIMSHLLDKALEDVPGAQGNGNRVLGIDVFFAPGSSPVRSLYLDNYGAVFFLKVHFPLVAPLEKHTEEKINTDSAWEEARQDLYGQRGQGNGAGEPGEEFNQDKVDRLKETLFETIKNASNIKGMKADDAVTICVSGGSNSGGRVRKSKTSPGGAGGNIMVTTASESAASRSFLTLRARKSDIDHYSKGQLKLEDFQKQCQLTAYGADMPSVAIESTMVNSYNVRTR